MHQCSPLGSASVLTRANVEGVEVVEVSMWSV